jgi:UDP-N-acetylglucosamine acyltransferase
MFDDDELFPGNRIHRTAIIDPDAKIGNGNTIGPFCVIGPDVVIGNNNVFTSHVSIGAPAQHRSLSSNHNGLVKIGNGNTFREFVTVHRSSPGGFTEIADRCYFMACAHVSHDSVVEDDVTMCNNVLLGGHSRVMRGATLGLGAAIHQYQTIGSYAMIGAGTIVPKRADILPGEKYAGNPARHLGINKIGVDKALAAGCNMADLTAAFWRLRGIKL